MANKSTRLTIDGISYQITNNGARKILPQPKPSKKKPEKLIVGQPFNVTVPVVVISMLRALCSMRFLMVLAAPIVLLVVVKSMQLNSYELAQTATNWFSSSNLYNLRFISSGIGAIIVVGWLLEAWLLKLLGSNRPPFWQLVGGLIASTSYFILLFGLLGAATTGLSVLVINKLYAFLPVLAVFLIICLWLATITAMLWCWSRRNRSVLRHTQSVHAEKLLLVPVIDVISPVGTVNSSLRRFLPATITLIILVLVVSFATLLFLSGLSSSWQILGMVVGVCLSAAVLSFDHIQKHRYWLADIGSVTKLRRYPSVAITILGVDSFLISCVLIGIFIQVLLPRAFDTAHIQSVRLKKLIEQSNLVIPSAKQVKPFDNTTKNK